jgi:hypothetical protein
MYKRGSRSIFDAGSIRGHAKVAVGKFNTDKTGGGAEVSVVQYCFCGEVPLCVQIRKRYVTNLYPITIIPLEMIPGRKAS